MRIRLARLKFVYDAFVASQQGRDGATSGRNKKTLIGLWPSQLNYMTLMNHIAAIAISNPAIYSGFLLTGYNLGLWYDGADLYLKLHLE